MELLKFIAGILEIILGIITSVLGIVTFASQQKQSRLVTEKNQRNETQSTNQDAQKKLLVWPWWFFVGIFLLIIPPIATLGEGWSFPLHVFHLGVTIPVALLLLAYFRPVPGIFTVVWLLAIMIGAVVVANPHPFWTILQICLYIPVFILARSMCKRRLAGKEI